MTIFIGVSSNHIQSPSSNITTESNYNTPIKKSVAATRRSINQSIPMDELTPNIDSLQQLNQLKFDTHTILNDYKTGIDKSYFYISNSINKSRDCVNRLKKELSTLAGASTLPDGIYLRVDENRMDAMRCMITGPSNTPYAYGLFLFDIYIPNTYPTTNPNVLFKTTGNNTFRFNPNLYADGMVCLSLLGTWEGPGWSATDSTILQVLVSIQSMIFDEKPYFNEPEELDDINDTYIQSASVHYNRPLRHATAAYAMLDQLMNPCHGFEDIIKLHFITYKSMILHQLDEWLKLNAPIPKSSAVLEYEQLLSDGQSIPHTLYDTLHNQHYSFHAIHNTDSQTHVNKPFDETVKELKLLLHKL